MIVLDFGADNTATYTPPYSNPNLVALGVPASPFPGAESLATARVARVISDPSIGFGVPIPSAVVTVYDYVRGSPVHVGPRVGRPHLELTVSGFSTIPEALSTCQCQASVQSVGQAVRPWDPSAPCVALSALLGSYDDGPIAEVSVQEQQNCGTPDASSTPTSTSTGTSTSSRTPSRSSSVTKTWSKTTSPSRSESVAATDTSSATATTAVTQSRSQTRTVSRVPQVSASLSLTRSKSQSRLPRAR